MIRAVAPRARTGGGRRRVAGRGLVRVAVAGAACAALVAMSATNATAKPLSPAAQRYIWSIPANFPNPVVPRANRMSRAKVDLGRFLFYEKKLSGNGTQSCGSCHFQSLAFTDGRGQSVGSTGELTARSSPSLANVAYNATLTWANPSLVTLERQMAVPLFGEHPVEMGVTDANRNVILARLGRDARYRSKFAAAFPGQRAPISWANITKSISAFQRTLISGNSRYDQYLRRTARLGPAETRGMELFFGEKAECFHCHGGFNFSDHVNYVDIAQVEALFHNTGLFNIGGTGAFPEGNRGVFELTGTADDMGAFRAPTLRNVGVTAPYMHDGSMATLEEVVSFYAAGGRVITDGPFAGDGRANPFKSGLINNIDLSPRDQADLVAFLGTLTDRGFLSNPPFSDPFGRRGHAEAGGAPSRGVTSSPALTG